MEVTAPPTYYMSRFTFHGCRDLCCAEMVFPKPAKQPLNLDLFIDSLSESFLAARYQCVTTARKRKTAHTAYCKVFSQTRTMILRDEIKLTSHASSSSLTALNDP